MAPSAPDTPPQFIHSELLCFAINKLNSMPFEVLVKTCAEFYSSDKIQEAKDLLWETVITVSHGDRRDLRNIKRKNTGASSKARADSEDIVKAIQVCDREGTAMPKFYAVDLSSIPFATPESLDIAVLLGQFKEMQADMQDLKSAMQTLQQTVPMANNVSQDPPRMWADVAASSPKRPPTTLPGSDQQQQQPSHKCQSQQQEEQHTREQQQLLQQHEQQQRERQRQQRQLQLSQPVQQPPPTAPVSQPPAVDSEGFTLVAKQKKKSSRNKLEVKGTNSATLLKGVAPPPRTLDLFVGRLDLSTTSEAVESHVSWMLQGVGKAAVEEIPHCAATYGYKGYKVTVPADVASLVLLPDKWPSHVSVKRFFQPKGDRGTMKPAARSKLLSRSTSVGNVAACV